MNAKLFCLLVSLVVFSNCSVSQKTKSDIGKAINNAANTIINNGNSGSLTNQEVIAGLKEALNVSSKASADSASKVNGFFKNPLIFIPFPPEAQKVKDYANKIGLNEQVQKFEMTLNRAAEEASKEAAPIFLNAIKGITIADGFAILKGNNNAATMYLKDKTASELTAKFSPIVKSAIQRVELTKYWNPIITAYNQIPLVQKQNPDLDVYVTDKALVGLFKLVENEELKIRKDPAARVTALLKKVFGSVTPK